MLARKFRLKSNEIPIIARKGKRYTGELFDIRAWFNNNLPNSKFSFAVSTKIDKNAVVRNTIKRKFKAAVRELEANNIFKKGSYLFVIKTKGLEEKKAPDLLKLIKEQLNS